MKVLKSGVEMTPSELSKSRGGGSCACGCATGENVSVLSQGMKKDSTCGCTCIPGDWETFYDMLTDAADYIQ